MLAARRNLIGAVLLAAAVAVPSWLHVRTLADADRDFTVDFAAGSSISVEGSETVARVSALMLMNPRMEALVVGHTGTLGSEESNLRLSQDRADEVAKALSSSGVSRDRVRTVGMGGREPLERVEGEHSRLYQQRLSRAMVQVFAPGLWKARP